MRLIDQLSLDIRFEEGLNACINCGTCTAICPAAEFYNYDPREIVDIVQSENEEEIEKLLKSETIWYCGECMSCKTRCPRDNTPGLVIMALRALSQDLGYFVESEKGRQQLALKRTVGEWILNHGYCVYPDYVNTENHPELGPVWDWYKENLPGVMNRLGGNYKGEGPGVLRKIPQEALDELAKIFEITGAKERYEKIEYYSHKKAKELGWHLDESGNNEYMFKIYNDNNGKHSI